MLKSPLKKLSFFNAHIRQSSERPMRLQNLMFFALLTWFGVEFLAFAFVVHEVGLSGALLLGFLTTIAGFSILRRIGVEAAWTLRAAFQDNPAMPRVFSEESFRNGSLAAFGAILLILPGFVSDLVGICLTVPAIQSLFIKLPLSSPAFKKDQNRAEPEILELSPQEWSRVEDPRQHSK